MNVDEDEETKPISSRIDGDVVLDRADVEEFVYGDDVKTCNQKQACTANNQR